MKHTSHKAKKTQRRLVLVEEILVGLRSPKIYDVISYRTWDESKIRAFMHSHLIEAMQRVFRSLQPHQHARTIERKATNAVLWEGDIGVTISNIQFFGVQHRPDFVINAEGVKIAVEIKRGESGSEVRDGIGQSMVYATHFDFVVYLFIDTSRDKKIKASIKNAVEARLVHTLWQDFNIKLSVI